MGRPIRKKYMKKLIILCLLLTSCGGNYNVNVSGTVNIKLDISDLTKYFEITCRNLYTSQSDIYSRVANKVDDFLTTVHNVSGV